MPKEIYKLYRKISLGTLLYTVIKWSFTPFKKMEEYVPSKGIIFDLGCGNGLFSNYLAMKSDKRKVVGIDSSEYRIKIAEATVGNRKNINFYLADVNKIKLIPCECIIFSDFLHHLTYKNQEDLIRRATENLKKNSILVIKEIDEQPRWKFIISFILDSLLNLGSRLYHRSSSEFKELLGKFGFIVEMVPVHRFLPLSNITYIARKI